MRSNKEKYLSFQKTVSQQQRLFQACRGSAKKRNLEFNISIEDIIIPSHCPYLGIELTNILGEGQVQSNASVDRIDSSKGYIKDNIQVISLRANILKGNSNIEQLLLNRIKELENQIKEYLK